MEDGVVGMDVKFQIQVVAELDTNEMAGASVELNNDALLREYKEVGDEAVASECCTS